MLLPLEPQQVEEQQRQFGGLERGLQTAAALMPPSMLPSESESDEGESGDEGEEEGSGEEGGEGGGVKASGS